MDRLLLNPWVSRAGNATFIGGVLVFVVRLVSGWDPLNLLAVLLLAMGVVLMGGPRLRKRWIKGNVWDESGRSRAISRLKREGTQHTVGHVIFFPPHQSRLADRVAALFASAGWTNFLTKTPQETFAGLSRYVEGVEVQGRSPHLVEIVAAALKEAGVPMVEENVQDQPEIQRGHPKYEQSMGRVQVRIGHTPEEAH